MTGLSNSNLEKSLSVKTKVTNDLARMDCICGIAATTSADDSGNGFFSQSFARGVISQVVALR